MRQEVAVTAMSISFNKDNESVRASLKRTLRRADRLTTQAVVAAAQALAKAPSRKLAPVEVGIFVGTAFGPLEANFRFLDTLLDDGEGQTSPILFSHSVHNMAAGYISRLLDLQGPALTITTFAWPFLSALDTAWQFMAQKRVRRALVTAVEAKSAVLEDALRRLGSSDHSAPVEEAVACVLDPVEWASPGYPVLQDLEINGRPCYPQILLTRKGERWTPFSNQCHAEPLDHALAIIKAFTHLRGKGPDDIIDFNITSPFGDARLAWSTNSVSLKEEKP
jgi:3-oxoacyl-[acyl-carrier-protein] synthase III